MAEQVIIPAQTWGEVLTTATLAIADAHVRAMARQYGVPLHAEARLTPPTASLAYQLDTANGARMRVSMVGDGGTWFLVAGMTVVNGQRHEDGGDTVRVWEGVERLPWTPAWTGIVTRWLDENAGPQ